LRTASVPFQIDVVGFDVGSEDPKKIRTLKEFLVDANALVDRQDPDLKNHFHDAHNSDELVNSIIKALDRDRLHYTVVRRESGATVKESQPTNSIWNVDDGENLPGTFRVELTDRKGSVAQSDIRLEGGELLSMVYKGGKLEFEPFIPEKGLARPAVPLTPAKDRMTLYPFVPVPDGDGNVVFKFGVQYEATSKFTPRPCDVWAEITPFRSEVGQVPAPGPNGAGVNDPLSNDRGPEGQGAADESEETAVFCDRSFVSRQRIPVLQFKFPKWPQQARSAGVKLWLWFPDERGGLPLEPEKISFAQALIDSRESEGRTKLASSPATIHVSEAVVGQGASQITISEIQSDAGDAEWCRIELSSPPTSVVHRYFLGEHRADHVFEYKDGARPNAADLEIRITSSRQLQGAKAASIPGSGTFLPVSLPGRTPTVN
jgi:hypothetical protein